jgi:hypothetical protein
LCPKRALEVTEIELSKGTVAGPAADKQKSLHHKITAGVYTKVKVLIMVLGPSQGIMPAIAGPARQRDYMV